jgi:hypothetical protein
MYEVALYNIIVCIIIALIFITAYNIFCKPPYHNYIKRGKRIKTVRPADDTINIDAPDKIYGCTKCEIKNTYSREFCMDNQPECPSPKHIYTTNALKKYRDEFFGFREKNWLGSASEGPDMVDKINEQLLDGDGELINGDFKDQDIGTIFNYLTDNYNK